MADDAEQIRRKEQTRRQAAPAQAGSAKRSPLTRIWLPLKAARRTTGRKEG